MIRYLAPVAVVFALASTAQAQKKTPKAEVKPPTFSRTFTAIDGRGNSSITTIETPATADGLNALGVISNQTLIGQTYYGGFPAYNNGVPSYGTNFPPGYNYGYPTYPAPGYAGYPAPGYGYGYPPPAPYGYAPGSYYVPSQTSYIGVAPNNMPWATPPTLTTVPQVINNGVNNHVHNRPYGNYPAPGYGYGYPALNYGYGYGYGSQTTISSGGASFQRGGLSVSIGGTSIQRR